MRRDHHPANSPFSGSGFPVPAKGVRRNLAATIDRVTADHDYTIITREGGKPAAVLIRPCLDQGHDHRL